MIDLDAYPSSQPRPPWRMPWRRVALAVCAVLLLVLGPAAVPEPGTSLPVAATSGARVASWLLTPDVLYTTHRTGRTGEYDVVARPLAPGAPAWTRQVHSEPEQPALRRTANLLFVEAGAAAAVTTVLEATTGAVRWTPPESDHVLSAGDRVFQQGVDGMALVDPATGRTLWRQAQAMDEGFGQVDTMGRYLVGIGDGDVAALAAGTGERVGSATVAEPETPFEGTVVDSRAYVWTEGDITALRVPDLGTLWTAPVAAPLAVADCGRLLCVTGAAGVTAIDPAGGAVRWTRTELAEWYDGVAVTRDGHVVEVDAETGDILSEWGRGRPVGDLMLRVDRDEAVWVSDLDGGRLIGTLRDVIPVGCAKAGDHLACPTTDLTVTAWKVR